MCSSSFAATELVTGSYPSKKKIKTVHISSRPKKKRKKTKTFSVSLSSILFPENNLCSLTGSHKNRVSHSWIGDSGAALLVRLFSYFHTFLTTDGVQIWILAVLKWMYLRACAVLRLYTWAGADGNERASRNGVTREMASVSDELRCATLTNSGCIA